MKVKTLYWNKELKKWETEKETKYLKKDKYEKEI